MRKINHLEQHESRFDCKKISLWSALGFKGVLAVLFVSFLPGCAQPTMDESKSAVYDEWRDSRVGMLLNIAQENHANGQLSNARKRLLEILSIDSENDSARLLLARISLELGDSKVALDYLEEIRTHSGESGEVCYLQGVGNENLGKYSAAFEAFHRSFELNPQSLDAVEAGAESLVAMGRVRDAQEYLEGHMNKAPNDAGTFELAGRLAMILKEYPKAAKYFHRARDFDSKNRRYPEMLARAEFIGGQFSKASTVLQEIINEKDYSPPTWVYMMLGDCYVAMNKAEKAENVYASAAQIEPDKPEIWVNIAKVALMQKEFDRAVRFAEKALTLDPDNSDAAIILGYTLLRQKKFTRAIEILESACERNTKDATLRCLLGKVYTAQGNNDQARKNYAVAFRSDPTDSIARELLTRANSGK